MKLDPLPLAVSSPCDQGHPVVFVHGFAHNRHVWDEVATLLSPSLRPYLLDLRGHGDSEWSFDRAYSLSDYASDLLPTVDAIGLRRFVLVAHSLGGLAATLFTAAHPERVEALILVDTGPSLSTAATAQIATDVSNAFKSFDSLDTYKRWLEISLPTAAADTRNLFAESSVVRRLDGRYELKLDPGVMAPAEPQTDWKNAERQLTEALRKVRCPTLLVRGGLSSVLSSAAAQEICDSLLTFGHLHNLERAGHAVMLDDAPGLCAALEHFVGEHTEAACNQPTGDGPSFGQ